MNENSKQFLAQKRRLRTVSAACSADRERVKSTGASHKDNQSKCSLVFYFDQPKQFLCSLKEKTTTTMHSLARQSIPLVHICSQLTASSIKPIFRFSCTSQSELKMKIAVCGAGGGIGQPLSLLLKQMSGIAELRLFDIRGAPGVAADVGHINTPAHVVGFGDKADDALTGADIVVISAGMPRKPGMTRDDLFATNASICAGLVDKVAQRCPDAILAIITNPVNSTVPIASRILRCRNAYNPHKLFGITTLDIMRASTFVAELKEFPPSSNVSVPVIAGHSGNTIVPLLSQTEPEFSFKPDEISMLTKRIQNAGTEVVEAKAGAGSATLSMAFAAARFVESLLRAKAGEIVRECTMTGIIEKGQKDLEFFSELHLLGPDGAVERLGIGKLSDFEKKHLDVAKAELAKNIEKGLTFGENFGKSLR